MAIKKPKEAGKSSLARAFYILERALKDSFGRRQFGIAERASAIAYFGGEPLSCAYCGDLNVRSFEHLVPVSKGGEAMLGNMVPACGPCDDSKGSRHFEDWMLGDAPKSPKTRKVADIPKRIEKIRSYAAHFGYVVRMLDAHLTKDEAAALARIKADLARARSEAETLVKSFAERMRTSQQTDGQIAEGRRRSEA